MLSSFVLNRKEKKRMNTKIRTLINKNLGNKKGSAMIEYAIGLLLLVTLVCFLFDVIIIAQKKYIVSQQTNVISRQLGIQGGVLTSKPYGFPGSDASYVTTSRMYKNVQDNLGEVGISTVNGEWSINIITYAKNGSIVNNQKLTPTTNITSDYNLAMDVILTYKYKWALWGQVIGDSTYRERYSSRHTISEYKYNYDVWGGEN